jgi:hypothetical protein
MPRVDEFSADKYGLVEQEAQALSDGESNAAKALE